jgi:hypothetical protein
MKRHWILAAAGSLLCLPASAQRPTPEEQQRTLDAARDIAIHYSHKLPDFLCTEQVERTTGISNKIQADKLTIQLSYSGEKESYKLVAMNGQPAKQPLESLDGLITGGEFGSLLLGIFNPESAAEFQWKSAATVRKRRAAVYSFKIARAKSHYILGHRAPDGKMVEAPAGYHGEVSLDGESSRVLRLTASADDIPKEAGVLSSSVEVDYDFVDVAGKSYLLPSHSEARMERGQRRIANVVAFTGYRKFQADSTIDFHAAATRTQSASSRLRRTGAASPMRMSDAAAVVCSRLTATPGRSPSRSRSRSAAGSRSETLLTTAGTPAGHCESATSSRNTPV